MQGTWAIDVDPENSVTILEGLRNGAGRTVKLLHAKGANIVNDPSLAARLNMHNRTMPSVVIGPDSPETMIEEALDTARKADTILLCLGEAKEHSGESSTRADITLPAAQRPLFDAIAAYAKESGKPLILFAMAGRPLALAHEAGTCRRADLDRPSRQRGGQRPRRCAVRRGLALGPPVAGLAAQRRPASPADRGSGHRPADLGRGHRCRGRYGTATHRGTTGSASSPPPAFWKTR